MATITVDTREHFIDRIKEIVLEANPATCPIFKFECLGQDLGDYLLENEGITLGIERKGISDFCGSYMDLKERLHKMRLHYDNVGLLLEGTYQLNNGMVNVLESGRFVPRLAFSTFSNFLTHQNSLGTWMFHTLTFDESIYRLINICNYLPKLDMPEPSTKCKNISELFVQLPGIGSKKLDKLREKHISPIEALNSDELPKKTIDFLRTW